MSGGTLRIICIGNRLEAEDIAGPRVFDRLTRGEVLPDIEVIDGGLAGLDLLGRIEGARRVVFVDAVVGYRETNGLVVLRGAEVAEIADEAFGHGAGLPYLLRVVPLVLEGAIPELYVVGLQGKPTPERVALAAELSIELAGCGSSTALHPVGK